jgi:hypothetical protein
MSNDLNRGNWIVKYRHEWILLHDLAVSHCGAGAYDSVRFAAQTVTEKPSREL